MQIRLQGGYEFNDRSDDCTVNGEISFLYDVPDSWAKWSEERRMKWLDRNCDKIQKHLRDYMYLSVDTDTYEDVD